MEQRAKRFGIPVKPTNSLTSTKNPLADEKALVRAKRFGIPIKQTKSSTDPAILQKRQERFGGAKGITTTSKNLSWNALDEEKKKKRLERFSNDFPDKRPKLQT